MAMASALSSDGDCGSGSGCEMDAITEGYQRSSRFHRNQIRMFGMVCRSSDYILTFLRLVPRLELGTRSKQRLACRAEGRRLIGELFDLVND